VSRFVTALLLVLLLSCHGTQELRSYCLEHPGECPACGSDADCEIVSNSCHPTASCADKRIHLLVNQIGCNYGYDVPDDSECVCRKSVCQKR
jgi:hypothetical protein